MAGRFRYALEPLRQTRRWDLDALLRGLGEVNAAIAAGESVLARLQAAMAAASEEWQARCSGAAVIAVDDFVTVNRYAADLAAQSKRAEADLEALGARRNDLMEQVAMAQRALDAVDEHHDQMRAQFHQARANIEFKEADDNWTTRKGDSSDHHG